MEDPIYLVIGHYRTKKSCCERFFSTGLRIKHLGAGNVPILHLSVIPDYSFVSVCSRLGVKGLPNLGKISTLCR